MQRRVFSQWLASAVPLSGLAWSGTAQAQTALKEGSDFVRLSKPVAVDTPAGQVEVLEFFAYSCIHCYRFEPLFAAWKAKQPAKVQARRVPVAFSEAFVPCFLEVPLPVAYFLRVIGGITRGVLRPVSGASE